MTDEKEERILTDSRKERNQILRRSKMSDEVKSETPSQAREMILRVVVPPNATSFDIMWYLPDLKSKLSKLFEVSELEEAPPKDWKKQFERLILKIAGPYCPKCGGNKISHDCRYEQDSCLECGWEGTDDNILEYPPKDGA